MRRHLLLVCALFMPGSGWCAAPAGVTDWLNRMSEAAHALNYEGTFIYRQEGRMQTMQLFHGNDGAVERERLIALDGAPREVVRAGGTVTAILPDRKSVVVEEAGAGGSLPIRLPTRIDHLDEVYQPRVGGMGRVAGQAARKIIILPRDPYRYGRCLWIEEKTGLLLKAELRDERNKVVEQLVFTRLDVHSDPLPDEALRARTPAGELTWHSREQGEAVLPTAESPWVVARLPAGFREERRRNHRLPGARVPVEQRVFTDGLAAVSVFIEPTGGEAGQAARTLRLGALNAYTRYLDHYKVTVLGDVPAVTVRLIGDGVTTARK